MNYNISLVADNKATDENTDQSPKVSLMASDGVLMHTEEIINGPYKGYHVYALSIGDSFMNLITGQKERLAIDLLFTAVNNRTIERNFFKRYCDLLDGSISAEEFEKDINENESEYIVDESGEPPVEVIKLAYDMSKKIKNVETVDDLSALFSFNPEALNKLTEQKQ